jgi:hypothetical protein
VTNIYTKGDGKLREIKSGERSLFTQIVYTVKWSGELGSAGWACWVWHIMITRGGVSDFIVIGVHMVVYG